MAVATWPQLRQELSILKGPVSAHGAPTYTLHDPVSHRFFRLGWLEMEILARWRLGDPEAIVTAINAETTLSATAEDVKVVLAFILNNALSLADGPADSARLKDRAERHKVSPFMFLVKNYLFLRLPLFKPDRFLERTLPLIKPLFRPGALWVIAILACFGLGLVLRNFTFFRRELEALFSLQGALIVLLAIGVSKAAHELGHAYAAKLLGLKVPSMGVAFMCFYPMLWTDTTEAWKCERRQDRLLVGLAGVGAELALAALASIAWALLSPGLGRELALTLAGVTWLTTLAININPFMRYDAYYIASDLFEMPMLQARSFVMAKWALRKKVLGLRNSPPEPMSPRRTALCILYAYCTWLYRFFLFLGIALLVYAMFFKALGLLLFLVEIVWFLAGPIFKELREWFRLRNQARFTAWGAILLTLLIAMFIPWRSSVVAPAVMDSEKIHVFYAPVGARLASTLPAIGARVEAGQVLARLASPDLDFKLQAVALRLRTLEIQTANAGLAPELWGQYAAQKEEMAGLMREEAGLAASADRLNFVAPFDGEVREAALDLGVGQWVAPREPLVYLTGGRAVVEVMVSEGDVLRLHPGDHGLFIPGSPLGGGAVAIKVTSIAPGAVENLDKPVLASTLGGPLPVRQGPQGQLWPDQAAYLVRCEVVGGERPPAVLTGLANLKGERRSLAGRALRYVMSGIVKESGL